MAEFFSGARPDARSKNDSRPASAATLSRPIFGRWWPSRDRWLILLLGLVGAVRVFFGAAAVPFFADTDENAHFDLVHKFARGEWPSRDIVFHDRETVDTWILHGSPEFLNRPGTLGVKAGYPPPVRTWQHTSDTASYIRAQCASPGRGRLPNHEAHEPPLYYLLAAVWYTIGSAFGMSSPGAVYWVRFLNAPVFICIILSAYEYSQSLFGREAAIAVGALAAFFPNTVFFTINSDVLSPLSVAVTLILLARWHEAEQPSPLLSAGVGLSAAAAVLVKLINLAVFAAVAAVIVLRWRRDGRLRKIAAAALPILVCAAFPIGLWCLRNVLVLGDWSGASAKTRILTWVPKPMGRMFDHPLFTLEGCKTFLNVLTISYFRGDSRWQAEPVGFLWSERFFLISSAMLPGIALLSLLRSRQEPRVRFGLFICTVVMIGYILELCLLSIRWDFGINTFPSQSFPYFASGRLASGSLIPFLTMYAYGAKVLTRRNSAALAALVVIIVLLMIFEQASYLGRTLHSSYNWFQLS